jgi:glycerol-3-phosphate acyltransferase PlsY
MHPAVGLLIAYLAGSVPTAYLAGRLLKGVDLRRAGSGNLGATNVYRNLGVPAAVVVLALDVAKGALPVRFLPGLLHAGDAGEDAALWWALAFGIAAIIGHSRPVFLLWKGGGKGVATATGVFAALVPGAVASTVVLCAAVVWLSGYMSVGSVVAAMAFPFIVWLDRGASPVLWVSIGVSLFICWSHRANYQRLRAGTEQRLFGGRGAEEGGS